MEMHAIRDVNSLEGHLLSSVTCQLLYVTLCRRRARYYVDWASYFVDNHHSAHSGKTPFFIYLTGILQRVWQKLSLTHVHPAWWSEYWTTWWWPTILNYWGWMTNYQPSWLKSMFIVEKAEQTHLSVYTMENPGQEPLVCKHNCTCI